MSRASAEGDAEPAARSSTARRGALGTRHASAAAAATAYGVIAERWKNAKPRSVTLEKAKDRMRILGCGR